MLLLNMTNKMRMLIIVIILNGILLLYYFQYVLPAASPIPIPTATNRILIFTSDNRPIRYGENQFYSLSALINFAYACRHGYTYRYFQIMYNNSRKIAKNVPVDPGCFNQALHQERSAHWAKLQVIWYVLETFSNNYDLFLYIDSDAVVNDQLTSIPTFLLNVSFVTASKCKTFSLNGCHLVFGYDLWKKTESFVVPNSGLFLFQSTPQLRLWIQLWWHLNMHESNFYGFYEQDSLWNLLENIPSPAAPQPTPTELNDRQEWNSKVKDLIQSRNLTQHVGILNIRTFGNNDRSQFFVHMTNYVGTQHRQPELSKIWQRLRESVNESRLQSDFYEQNIVRFDTAVDRIPPLR